LRQYTKLLFVIYNNVPSFSRAGLFKELSRVYFVKQNTTKMLWNYYSKRVPKSIILIVCWGPQADLLLVIYNVILQYGNCPQCILQIIPKHYEISTRKTCSKVNFFSAPNHTTNMMKLIVNSWMKMIMIEPSMAQRSFGWLGCSRRLQGLWDWKFTGKKRGGGGPGVYVKCIENTGNVDHQPTWL
jgi:hypothetical protein